MTTRLFRIAGAALLALAAGATWAQGLIVDAAGVEAALKRGAVVWDSRDADDYAAGHIPGAVNLREIFTFLATSTAEGLSELKQTFAEAFGSVGLSGAETAVLYEESMNSGFGQSCRGYFLLTWLLVHCATVDEALAEIRQQEGAGGHHAYSSVCTAAPTMRAASGR